MIYDVAIIGAGPGGYVAAARAAQLGARVLIVEKDRVGGTCLNWGCIPTKAFLSDVRPMAQIRASSVYRGAEALSVSIEEMVARKNRVVDTMTRGVSSLLKSNGVTVVQGRASFVNRDSIHVVHGGIETTYKTAHTIIATGSRVASIPRVRIDGRQIISSNEILDIQQVPKELIIIGGGVIGVEFSTIFNALGTRVTLVEMLPSIISTEDDEIIQGLTAILKKRGITLMTDTRVTGASSSGGQADLLVEDTSGRQTHLSAEKVLIAAGRTPYTEGLCFETIGLDMDGDFIRVNTRMETNVDGIYAIGDVIGKMMLAHAASAEGIVAVENITGKSREIDYRRVPSCIYTFPEVASVGLNERDARAEGLDIGMGTFPFRSNGKAMAMDVPDGFVKIIAEKELGEIIGVHILGVQATELIGECVLAMDLEAAVEDLGRVVKGHPTLSEAITEAALDWGGVSIHLPKRR